ncbi:MAG: glycoside hydrolase family 43 protein [Burkholderiales bacterium]|nr:glycoside hydrolase family 43 protein [Phycisphaerae bacterium]
MKLRALAFIFVLLVHSMGNISQTVAQVTSLVTGADPAWSNPLVLQRADPFVYLHTDGYYYFMGSVPEYDRLELRRAKSLSGLGSAEPKTIWRKHAKGPMGNHIWAPEIHFIDGKWYVYFAAGNAENKWHIRMYVLENASANPLEGEWIERGQIKTDWESFSLDSTTFVHHGQRYLLWAQKQPNTPFNSDVYIAKMDTPLSIVRPQVMLARTEADWETVKLKVAEGPAVLVRNDRVFITYSVSRTDDTYRIGLLTASADADLLDPKSWTKSPGPVMVSDPAAGQFGPGHNSFTTTPDGKTDIIVYHARPYKEIKGEPLYDPNRHTRAQVVRWKADGTPDFGTPVADGAYAPK